MTAKPSGSGIRKFRELSGLSDCEIAGMSENRLRKIEEGEKRATHKDLEILAISHKISTNEYMGKIAEMLD